MSFLFDANGTAQSIGPNYSGSIPATGAEAIFRLKALLVSAGWTVTQSSDGSTYNGTADIITSAGTGAGGMFNPLAYFVIAAPKTRQLLFQCSFVAPSDGSQWKIAYSPAAGFVGNAQPSDTPADATDTPSATDEIILVGGGNDNSPSFDPIFAADSTYRLNILAGNAASNSCFLWFTNITGQSYIQTCFLLDVMQTGTSVSADPDPSMFYFTFGASDTSLNVDLLNGQMFGNYNGTLISAYALSFTVQGNYFWPNYLGSGGGVNPYTGKDDFSPVPYGIPSFYGVPSGWKGVSSILTWNSVASRPYGNPYEVLTSKDYITITGDSTGTNAFVVIPWNGSTLIV
jgi:hypothetical protein